MGMPCPNKYPKTVLVVEDDDATREAFKLFLEGQGYGVTIATNGQEALDRLRQDAPPSLILLDLMMPVMDGYQFRQAQLQDLALASVPVVVLSAAGQVAERNDLLGDVGYLQKPVDADLFLAALQRFTVPRKPVILVVEDEAGVRTLLDVALRHYGFGVRLAACGQEAVELYGRDHEAIAILLLDVQMPGLDGSATLAALQKITPELQCCFMSGHTGKYSAEDLLRMGAAHVFMKPFVSLSLVTRLLGDIACQAGYCRPEKEKTG